ncbi:hypothetical protein MTYP_01745 [Methylophilaceae bacterium]|nr:hypothetical protein MTYP_01745 [Methylophilaceae bacterium]
MNANKQYRCALKLQQGVVLVITLIVLVAMTLAGIGLWRSVDTGMIISGNLAFKQSSLTSADRGVQAALNWIDTTRNADGGSLTAFNESNTGQGYYAFITDDESLSSFHNEEVWANAVDLGVDDAGNRVEYIIHRMCNGTGSYNDVQCSTYLSTGDTTGCSNDTPSKCFTSNPALYFRVTARVHGPRNTRSVVQANVLIPT